MITIAIVLAAGGSARLGRPKQLLDYHGEPLIVHAARVARGAKCEQTIVVWSSAAPPPPLGDVQLVENPEWREGIASSIRAAVRAADPAARLLFTLVDQPLVTSAHLRALADTDAPIVATGYRGAAGVPAVFAPEFREDLLALEGDRGARVLIERHGAVALPFEPAAIDIDSDDDYRKL